jgi:hypothetical protein
MSAKEIDQNSASPKWRGVWSRLGNELICLLGWLSLAAVAVLQGQSQPFQNGDFELTSFAEEFHPPGYDFRALAPGDTNITGWVTTAGLDLAAPPGITEYIRGYFQDPLQPLGAHVQLGFYDTLSGIQQTFTTLPNQSYTVNFYLASNPLNLDAGPAILRVSAADHFSDFVAAPGTGDGQNMGWQFQQFNFTADASGVTTLQFWNLQGIAAIDGVAVVVPEPQAAVLIFLGLCGLMANVKLRRRIENANAELLVG